MIVPLIVGSLFYQPVPAHYPAGVGIDNKNTLSESVKHNRVGGFRAYAFNAQKLGSQYIGRISA